MESTRKVIFVVAILALGASAFLTPAQASGVTSSTTVRVFNFEFEDQTTRQSTSVVLLGESVTFRFTNGVHTATSVAGESFDSGIKQPSDKNPTYTFTPSESGIISYICEIHPLTMQGTIVVI